MKEIFLQQNSRPFLTKFLPDSRYMCVCVCVCVCVSAGYY
jgi:hypothetical protein